MANNGDANLWGVYGRTGMAKIAPLSKNCTEVTGNSSDTMTARIADLAISFDYHNIGEFIKDAMQQYANTQENLSPAWFMKAEGDEQAWPQQKPLEA